MAKPHGAKRRLVLSSNYYLLTITNPHKLDYVSKEDLYQALRFHYGSVHICNSRVEAHGLYKQLHLHAILYLPTNFYRGSHKRYGKLYFHYKLIQDEKDLLNCIDYIYKHNPNTETDRQLEQTNYYHYHYGFEDKR